MTLHPPWPPQDPEVAQALQEVWQSGDWGRYQGARVARLEEELADYHGLPFVRLCASGTVAIEIALHGLGVDASSEVILGGYDFGGNFRCVEHLGARPILVDVDRESGCVGPAALEEALSERTAAVIVSHLHGGLADMQSIMAWATAHAIPVLEDACQAHGAIVNGRVAGSWGNIATLSFGGSKLMTSGRGGAVMTGSAELAQRMKIYADQGNLAYPLSELQAAVLLPQLERLDERNQRRRTAAKLLRQTESPALNWIGNERPQDHCPSYYKVGWLVAEGCDRAEVMRRSAELGVSLQPGFRGFHKRSERRCGRIGELKNGATMAERLLLLHHPYLLGEIERVAEAIGSL
jgi:dTDP-4-amino-4,6-dideoxygalactose transaminase